MAEWALNSLYHTVVNCRDLDESVAFYRLLGFEVLNDRRNVVWPEFVAGIFGLERANGRGVLMVLVIRVTALLRAGARLACIH